MIAVALGWNARPLEEEDWTEPGGRDGGREEGHPAHPPELNLAQAQLNEQPGWPVRTCCWPGLLLYFVRLSNTQRLYLKPPTSCL